MVDEFSDLDLNTGYKILFNDQNQSVDCNGSKDQNTSSGLRTGKAA